MRKLYVLLLVYREQQLLTSFILIMFIQIFCFYIDRLEIILGGEGGCLDWFFVRLLTRDPPSEVCSMQM